MGHVGTPLVPVPSQGRAFTASRRVRLGDVSPRGRLRLDAVVRYLQDVANDDAHDAGIANPEAWVVRRTVVEVGRAPRFRERVRLTTFCSGTGPSWAERRTSIVGDGGGLVETASLWVQVDPTSGRPVRLGSDFSAVYGAAAAGRQVRARLEHGDPPHGRDGAGSPEGSTAAGSPWGESRAFPLRFADFDPFGHVNNAVYWAVVEETMAAEGRASESTRVEVEHRRALERGAAPVVVAGTVAAGGYGIWVLDEGAVAASALITPLA